MSLGVRRFRSESDAAVRAALWSAYFFGARLRPSNHPVWVRPIPPDEALDLVEAIRDPHRLPRQLRVARQFRRAASAQVRERADLLLEVAINDSRGACLPDPVHCTVSYDAATHISTVEATVCVNVGVERIAKTIDPRSWARCGDAVETSFPVNEPAKGQYRYRQIDAPLGERWKGLLFERAVTAISSLENVLWVCCSGRMGNSARVEYRLYDSLTCVLGPQSTVGGLNIDSGHIKATGYAQDQTEIEAVKHVKLRDFTPQDPGVIYDIGDFPNQIIGVLLSLWTEDIAQMNPCCDPDRVAPKGKCG